MIQIIMEAMIRRFYYDSHNWLRMHLADFLDADNFAKTPNGLTPHEHIGKISPAEQKDSDSIRSIKCRD